MKTILAPGNAVGRSVSGQLPAFLQPARLRVEPWSPGRLLQRSDAGDRPEAKLCQELFSNLCSDHGQSLLPCPACRSIVQEERTPTRRTRPRAIQPKFPAFG